MKKEILAYAITHAPTGVKGGPYWAERGGRTSDIRLAMRFSPEGIEAATNAANHADARVIRIVRARPSAEPTPQPSEASAVEVLRELVAWDDAPSEGQLEPTIHRARRVLAASGPDPSEVVRAAMAELEAWDAYLAAPATRSRAETEALDKASKKRFAAVDAYRKAGGK